MSQQSSLLLQLGVSLDPRLRLVVALFWTIVFWGLTVSLWQKRPFAQRAIPLFLAGYGALELGLLFIFAEASARRGWMLNALFFGGTILFSYWALHRGAAARYFEGKEVEGRR